MVTVGEVRGETEIDVFEEYESNVRSYCRRFPAVFQRAKNAMLYSEDGQPFIDFARLGDDGLTGRVSSRCYERGLIAETVGRNDAVLKLIPPLTTETSVLEEGCRIVRDAIRDELA